MSNLCCITPGRNFKVFSKTYPSREINCCESWFIKSKSMVTGSHCYGRSRFFNRGLPETPRSSNIQLSDEKRPIYNSGDYIKSGNCK